MAYKDLDKRRATRKAYRANNPDKMRAYYEKSKLTWRPIWNRKHRAAMLQYQKAYHFFNKYGITIEQREEMYAAQKGCCALCGKPVEYDNMDTEHNHITGKVRGLTCHQCNVGLGMFFVDEKGIEILNKAIRYLGEK